jgi:hypothetical protein
VVVVVPVAVAVAADAAAVAVAADVTMHAERRGRQSSVPATACYATRSHAS